MGTWFDSNSWHDTGKRSNALPHIMVMIQIAGSISAFMPQKGIQVDSLIQIPYIFLLSTSPFFLCSVIQPNNEILDSAMVILDFLKSDLILGMELKLPLWPWSTNCSWSWIGNMHPCCFSGIYPLLSLPFTMV